MNLWNKVTGNAKEASVETTEARASSSPAQTRPSAKVGTPIREPVARATMSPSRQRPETPTGALAKVRDAFTSPRKTVHPPPINNTVNELENSGPRARSPFKRAPVALMASSPKKSSKAAKVAQPEEPEIKSEITAETNGVAETETETDPEPNGPAATGFKLEPQQPDTDMEEEHEFEEIVGWRWAGDLIELEVKWANGTTSWEPEAQVQHDLGDTVIEYWGGHRPLNPSDPDLYDIFAILDHTPDFKKFQIHWTGFPAEDNTWLPRATVNRTAPAILKEYLQSTKAADDTAGTSSAGHGGKRPGAGRQRGRPSGRGRGRGRGGRASATTTDRRQAKVAARAKRS